jgi:hypothetical protein
MPNFGFVEASTMSVVGQQVPLGFSVLQTEYCRSEYRGADHNYANAML